MAVITLTGRRQRRFALHCSTAVYDHERQALKATVKRWLKEYKGSTATASNLIADDGQTTTCFLLLCHQTSPVFREQRGKSEPIGYYHNVISTNRSLR